MLFRFQKSMVATAFLLAANALFSQNISISGSVADGRGAGLDGATVSLLKSADSSFVKAEWSGADGHFEFLEIKKRRLSCGRRDGRF